MGSTGFFLPFLIISFVTGAIILCLIERMFEPKEPYEKWLEGELKRNPDYIDWLKVANGGKDYKLGLRILKRIENEKR